MLCDICHKNEASIHITEIINGQSKELHVCQNCAEQESIKMHQNFGMADLLSGLVDFPNLIEKEHSLKCPTCGMTYADFKKVGRVGCGSCYVAFRKALLPLIKNIHGSIRHVGKEPDKIVHTNEKEAVKKIKTITAKEKISELKEKLQVAVETEEYEEAAALRDKIKSLEKKNGNK